MEKFVLITYLFDFYYELLTEKQRDLIHDYYFEDLSLGELSIQHNISRQSVFDTIKKAEQKLLDYEQKLHLYEKHKLHQEMLKDIEQSVIELDTRLTQSDLKDKSQDIIERIEILMNRI